MPPAKQNEGIEYTRLEKLGEGTYGVVYKARNVQTGEIVAIKEIKMNNNDEGLPSTTLREISVLRNLNHINIVNLLNVEYQQNRLFLVFEFVEHDLKSFLDSQPDLLDLQTIKKLFYQMVRALYECQRHRILHRDLKPQNILVSPNLEVKVADLGLAREHGICIKELTHEVVTLWYRPPEVLLGAQTYSHALDMWSLGCILAELFTKQAFFMGDCEIDQLYQIFKILGTPNSNVWKDVEQLKDFQPCFPRWRRKPVEDWITPINPCCEADALDLIQWLLAYRPAKRITARVALTHPFFNSVRGIYEEKEPKKEQLMDIHESEI